MLTTIDNFKRLSFRTRVDLLYDDMCKGNRHHRNTVIPKSRNRKRKITIGDEYVRSVELSAKSDFMDIYEVCSRQVLGDEHDNLPVVHAYRRNLGVRSNIRELTRVDGRKKWIVKADIQNFYPSIRREYLTNTVNSLVRSSIANKIRQGMHVETWNYLIQTDDDSMYANISTLDKLIYIVTPGGRLSQGYILSPVLSNMYMLHIDYVITNAVRELLGIDIVAHSTNTDYMFPDYVVNDVEDASRFVKYCRYSDDIYIMYSAALKVKPEKIYNMIKDILLTIGLKTNNIKTKFIDSHNRQMCMGVTINSKNARIDKDRREQLRREILDYKGKLISDEGKINSPVLRGKIEYAMLVSGNKDRRIAKAVMTRAWKDMDGEKLSTILDENTLNVGRDLWIVRMNKIANNAELDDYQLPNGHQYNGIGDIWIGF